MPKAQYKRNLMHEVFEDIQHAPAERSYVQKNKQKVNDWSYTSTSSGVSSLHNSIESTYSEDTDDDAAVMRKIQTPQPLMSASRSSNDSLPGTSRDLYNTTSSKKSIKNSAAKQRFKSRTSSQIVERTKVNVSRKPTLRRKEINKPTEQQSVPQLNISQPLYSPLTSSPQSSLSNVHHQQLDQLVEDELTNEIEPIASLPQIQTPHNISRPMAWTAGEQQMQMMNISTPPIRGQQRVNRRLTATPMSISPSTSSLTSPPSLQQQQKSNEDITTTAMITSPHMQRESELPPNQTHEPDEEKQQEMEQQEIEQMEQQQEEIDLLEYFDKDLIGIQIPLIKKEPMEEGYQIMAPNPLPRNASRAQRLLHLQQTKIYDYHREMSMFETRSYAHRIWFKGEVWSCAMDKIMFNHDVNSDQFTDLALNINILADVEYFRLRFIHMQDDTDRNQMIECRNNHASCVECNGILFHPNCHPGCEQRVPHREICKFLDLCVRKLKECFAYKLFEKKLRKLNEKRMRAQLV